MKFLKISNQSEIVGIAVNLLLMLAIILITSFIFSKLLKLASGRFRDNIFNRVIISSVKKPAQLIILGVGLSFCLELLSSIYSFAFKEYVGSSRYLLIVYGLVWFIFNVISGLEKHLVILSIADRSRMDKATLGALANFARVIILVLALLVAADGVGIRISSLIALAGGGSLVVAFASKDLLSNLFGAAMVYLDKPFKIGDQIRIPEKQIEGTVEKIGLRCTIIQTVGQYPIYVPNSLFSLTAIENRSRIQYNLISESVSVKFSDAEKVEKITNEINQILTANNKIDQSMPCNAKVENITGSDIKIAITAYTKILDLLEFYRLKQKILLQIAEVINAESVN